MDAVSIVAKWLYETLHNDSALLAAATGGIHDTLAGDAAPPFVVYQIESPEDNLVVGAQRHTVTCEALVRAIGQTDSYAALDTAVGRISALLDRVDSNQTVNDGNGAAAGRIVACFRTAPYLDAYYDESTGQQWRHKGGMYRVTVQEV